MSIFQKATKRAVRARVALDGPSGSGKTYTGLTWASVLGERVALADTERGSASLYADLFNFDVVEFSPPFHPDRLTETIKTAEKEGYDCLVIDSLSHFWDGEGGTLDIVDAAAAKEKGNSWAAWKSGTPVLRHLIDTILAADLHVIATMRSKQEWVLQEYTGKDGKSHEKPVRVGMAPVMRAGTEYEFTVVADLDLEHRMTVTKSRAPILADQIIQPGRAAEAAEAFAAWTSSGEAMATREQVQTLKQRMDKIEPRDVRLAAKKAFAEQFGNPDYLVASKLPEADGFVSGYEGTPAVAAPTDPAATGARCAEPPFTDDDRTVEPKMSPLPGEAPTLPAAAGPTPAASGSPPIGGKEAQKLRARLGAILKGAAVPADFHDDLAYLVTKGRTTHFSEVTDVEAGLAEEYAEAVKEGHYDPAGIRAAIADLDLEHRMPEGVRA